MKCALIGTSKFAEIHFEQLVRINFTEITLISRNLEKNRTLIKKLKKKYPRIKILINKIDILKKKKFDLIDICSSNHVHQKHLEIASKTKSIILIEKPIISLLKLKNYKNFINRIYKNNKKIIVLYQMLYLAQTFKKNINIVENIKKITSFKFHFSTGGRYTGNNICVDLMPHAITFIMGYFKINNFKNNINLKQKSINKNSWRINFIYKNIKLEIILEEKKENNTILNVKINNKKFKRLTKIENSKFANYFGYKNKITKIKNPIVQVFDDFNKNKRNKAFYKKNKLQTLNILNINHKMLY